jgi:asparagine synthase (glutamine-hydrolysing)
MGTMIAVLNKEGKNAAEAAISMLKESMPPISESFGLASPTKISLEKSLDRLQSRAIESSILIGCAFSKVLPRDRSQPLKLKDATLVFDGRIYPASSEISDAEIAAKSLQGGEKSAGEFVKLTDGDFVFVMAEAQRLVVGRDVMGVRPLYCGENRDYAALASERKALWAIGIEDVDSFKPGCVGVVDKSGFRLTVAREFDHVEPRMMSMRDASKELQNLLQRPVVERTSDLKECAVAFSGGLDSSLIAFLARKRGINVQLIHVGLEKQPEKEHAEKVADKLELPIHCCSFRETDVKRVLPNVLRLIETPDPVQTSIGIPIYWAAEKAAEMRIPVMLAGQAADELFGGYRRYVDEYVRQGCEKVRETIFNDVTSMYRMNFERDSKICSFHGIELRLPFASYDLAQFATTLPVTLKLEPSDETLRKLVLRQAAQDMGLAQLATARPKKAIQYTTGVGRALTQIAKKEGLRVNEYLRRAFRSALKGRTVAE